MKKELVFLLGVFEGIMLGLLFSFGFEFGHRKIVLVLVEWLPFKNSFFVSFLWVLLIFLIALPWVPIIHDFRENILSFLIGILAGLFLAFL